MPSVALVREPSASLERCELTHLARVPIDVALARVQHAAYVSALRGLGIGIVWLPPLPDQADAVFVEDTAVILPEVAVITRPGATSRQPEVATVAQALNAHRPLRRIQAPACLDGGDVLRIGRRILVGLSSRTNEAGVSQLRTAVQEFGYEVRAVHVMGCLHLKSACTAVSSDTVLANLDYVQRELLGDVTVVEVDAREPGAANTLTLEGVTIVSAKYPRTGENLRRGGIRTQSLDVSELAKAEAGLTCMSLVISAT
jgi:dimethylargininase